MDQKTGTVVDERIESAERIKRVKDEILTALAGFPEYKGQISCQIMADGTLVISRITTTKRWPLRSKQQVLKILSLAPPAQGKSNYGLAVEKWSTRAGEKIGEILRKHNVPFDSTMLA